MLWIDGALPTTSRTISIMMSVVDGIGIVAGRAHRQLLSDRQYHSTYNCPWSTSNVKERCRVPYTCMNDAIMV